MFRLKYYYRKLLPFFKEKTSLILIDFLIKNFLKGSAKRLDIAGKAGKIFMSPFCLISPLPFAKKVV